MLCKNKEGSYSSNVSILAGFFRHNVAMWVRRAGASAASTSSEGEKGWVRLRTGHRAALSRNGNPKVVGYRPEHHYRCRSCYENMNHMFAGAEWKGRLSILENLSVSDFHPCIGVLGVLSLESI